MMATGPAAEEEVGGGANVGKVAGARGLGMGTPFEG